MAFTLAHLSDPHLAPLPRPRWRELIGKRITGYVNWQRSRRFIHEPEVLAKIIADMRAQASGHIALTGDIANIALPAEFTHGRDWLQSLGSPADVSYVLGNHDIYVNEAAPIAMRERGDYMSGDNGARGFPYLRRRGPLALIGLTTGVPTAPFLATGRLGERQLGQFSALLEQLRDESLFRVVMIHHPPVSPRPANKRLVDAAAFLAVIAERGADLVLHGHDHLHMLNWLAGPKGVRVPAVGVPSASAAPGTSHDAAAYNVYAVDGSPGAWRCEMTSRGINSAGAVIQQRRVKLSA
ncbi:MAG TPA: metallophosphoesterase [Pseudolabrys sp.]